MSYFEGEKRERAREVGLEKKPEHYAESLTRLLGDISLEMNEKFKEYTPAEGDIISEDCSIRLRALEESKQGPYTASEIDEDEEFIREREVEWSSADNPNVQDFYKEKFIARRGRKKYEQKYGNTPPEEMVREEYKEEKKKSKGCLFEMAKTAVFHKMLKPGFAVMRASAFDDYKNGIDNVLVNIETGDVVCAFDEVYDDIDHKRTEDKLEKMKKKARQGGAEIKYGITFEKDSKTGKNQLVKKPIRNVPNFYLALSATELKELLAGMSYGINEAPNKVEAQVFNKFVGFLAEQVEILKTEKIPNVVMENLNKFSKSLRIMEGKGEKS